MKQSYLTIWVSACLCMCLSLCGNVSAQGVTSFNIQRPDFVSAQMCIRDSPKMKNQLFILSLLFVCFPVSANRDAILDSLYMNLKSAKVKPCNALAEAYSD